MKLNPLLGKGILHNIDRASCNHIDSCCSCGIPVPCPVNSARIVAGIKFPQLHAAPARVFDAEPDKITLEVIENALRSARFEMDAVVYRGSVLPFSSHGYGCVQLSSPVVCELAGAWSAGCEHSAGQR